MNFYLIIVKCDQDQMPIYSPGLDHKHKAALVSHERGCQWFKHTMRT